MADQPARTAFVIIELHLRPSPPRDTRPYWWGNGRLTFRDPHTYRIVWEQELGEMTARSSEAGRVEWRDGFGWVLVLTLKHDRARDVLGAIGLPDSVSDPEAAGTPQAEEDQRGE